MGKYAVTPTNAERRQQAEKSSRALWPEEPATLNALPPEATQNILHELRVHQIQLEMQNEELRRTQLDLDAARARYFDLYDLAPIGYLTLSEPGLILEANFAAATLLGVDRGEKAAPPAFSRFICKEDQGICYRHCKQLFETGEPQAWELRMVKRDGTVFWAHLKASAAQSSSTSSGYAAAGTPVCHILMNDITALKQAEAERKNLESQIRQLQKAESLGCMAGAIAHHFNNQLQAVMGNLELAMISLPRGAEGAEANEFLGKSMESARKAGEVSTQLLTFLGQSHAKREPLDLSELCRRSLRMLWAVIPKDVTLVSDLPSPGPTIRANADEIQQVLTNLVTNAWEASDHNRRLGTICLSVRTVAGADLTAVNRYPIDWQSHDSAYACLQVEDTGCGIADSDLPKLFDPFFSTKIVGRGLGLSVVLGILRTHGGAVTVESEPDRGSVFRVFLPITTEVVPLQSLPAAQSLKVAGGGLSACPAAQTSTVLVVEDESTVLEMVTNALKHFGFAVLPAEDGVEAVEVFKLHQAEIGCVLCDLTMPRMNGWETLTALRKLAPGIPLILASGYRETQVMEGDHPELPSAFLNKPYELNALINAIRRILLKRKG